MINSEHYTFCITNILKSGIYFYSTKHLTFQKDEVLC